MVSKCKRTLRDQFSVQLSLKLMHVRANLPVSALLFKPVARLCLGVARALEIVTRSLGPQGRPTLEIWGSQVL